MANVQNLASGTLVGSISASTTSLSVYVGEGSSFVIETVWPATPFYATIMPAVPNAGVANSLDSEIVEVTAVSNLNGNTILTVNRGQRGTSGKAFSDGDIVTAAIYTEDIGSASPGKGCPIGTILPYSSTTIPEGYLVCDGSAVSRTTYADLFDVIGTTYGTGDGSTTFNLPNLTGRVPVGQDANDTSFDVLGETGGEKTHTLVNNELPKIDAYWQFHGTEHGTNVYNLKGSNSIGTRINGKYQAISGASGAYSYADVGIRFGNNGAHNNLQPYTVLVYIIKYKDLAGTVAEVKNEYTESADDVYSTDYINTTLFDLIYPVGSIYMSINNVNPGTLFGGTWEAWGTGRTPVGVDTSQTEFNTVEKTGGEKTHTLTVNEMPAHNHGVGLQVNTAAGNQRWGLSDNLGTTTPTANRGGGGAHNNLQPYITCYMWKRTA